MIVLMKMELMKTLVKEQALPEVQEDCLDEDGIDEVFSKRTTVLSSITNLLPNTEMQCSDGQYGCNLSTEKENYGIKLRKRKSRIPLIECSNDEEEYQSSSDEWKPEMHDKKRKVQIAPLNLTPTPMFL